MANSRQAAKRARQAENNRRHNQALRSRMRTAIKRVRALAVEGNHADAMAALRQAQAEVGNMVGKNIIPRNRASRIVSRLNASVKAISA